MVVLAYFLVLSLESFYLYQNFFQYGHVFSKITNLFLFFGICAFFSAHDGLKEKHLIFFLIFTFLIVSVLFKREIYSISSFLNHQRGFPAPSVYIWLLGCLYFFNDSMLNRSENSFYKFLICLFFIIFLQHRSVWVATAAAILFNFAIIKLKSWDQASLMFYLPRIFFLSLIILVAGTTIIVYKPEIFEKLLKEINVIQNATTAETGAWRYLQMQSYWPFIKENIIIGMRFEGFELPIQFYHPDSDIAIFGDGTGHHFHSNYFDILFYFGIIGMILYMVLPFHFIAVSFTKEHLSIEALTILAFVFSGLVYSVSYVLPSYYYVVFGLGFANVIRDNRNSAPQAKQTFKMPYLEKSNTVLN